MPADHTIKAVFALLAADPGVSRELRPAIVSALESGGCEPARGVPGAGGEQDDVVADAEAGALEPAHGGAAVAVLHGEPGECDGRLRMRPRAQMMVSIWGAKWNGR